MEENRATTLLRACLELFKRQEESPFILNMLEETVHYDDEDCDGSCLMYDIEAFFGVWGVRT